MLLALLSGLLSAVALWIMTRRQGRLPDPSGYLMARVPLARDDDGMLSLDTSTGLTMDDMVPVNGSRSRYHLTDELSVRRWTSLNPFAEIAAEVAVHNGVAVAAPGLGRGRGRGRRARISPRFPSLLAVGLPSPPDVAPHGALLLRHGTRPPLRR